MKVAVLRIFTFDGALQAIRLVIINQWQAQVTVEIIVPRTVSFGQVLMIRMWSTSALLALASLDP